MTEDCATCRFFAPKDEGSGGSGDCRRHAPVVTPFTETNGLGQPFHMPITSWPQVGEAEGCGDWDSCAEFEEVEEAPSESFIHVIRTRVYRCTHCSDGEQTPRDAVDWCCPKCGTNTMPF